MQCCMIISIRIKEKFTSEPLLEDLNSWCYFDLEDQNSTRIFHMLNASFLQMEASYILYALPK